MSSHNIEMRHCKFCDRILSLDEFPKSKGVHIKKCRECKRAYDRDWIAAKRQYDKIRMIKKLKNIDLRC